MKYIVTLLVTIVLALMVSNLLVKIDKKSAKSHRISCHKTTTTFEKVLVKDSIKNLQNSLKNGDFSLHVNFLPSKYMPSKLFLHVKKEDIDSKFRNLFAKGDDKNGAKVEIFVYENDKQDPNKKTKKSKLYEGYLLFNFYVADKIAYKLQLDFFESKGEDIPQLLECAKKSVLSL